MLRICLKLAINVLNIQTVFKPEIPKTTTDIQEMKISWGNDDSEKNQANEKQVVSCCNIL